jgi:anti-sigma B factor antagonist
MVTIETRKENDVLEMAVGGEVDATSSIDLDNALKNAMEHEKKIIVNLSDLAYISSAGLGVFVSHLEDVKDREIQWVLFGLSENVFQVFKLLGLPDLMKIVNTKEEAIDALQ